jgi:two-component system nitrogen regulation response regulator GlnG
MSPEGAQILFAAFDRLCVKLLQAAPPDEDGDVYEAVIGALEGRLLRLALRESGGNQVVAARRLGIHRNTLRRKMGKN